MDKPVVPLQFAVMDELETDGVQETIDRDGQSLLVKTSEGGVLNHEDDALHDGLSSLFEAAIIACHLLLEGSELGLQERDLSAEGETFWGFGHDVFSFAKSWGRIPR